jgi:uncharacterized protein (TIGR03435 family)
LKPAIQIVACALMAASALAADDPPAFDVASVKPNRSVSRASSTSRSGGRVALDNVSLREAIEVAYGIPPGREDELSGPAWLATEKFDIVATCPPETSRDRVREMLQTLLAHRFGLRTHRENRRVKGYVLVAARRRPPLHPAAPGAEENLTFGDGRVIARAMSMSSLADRLSGPIFKLGQPVVDATGIQGVYDFTLLWATDTAPAGTDAAPSIFTTLEEQLGVKLEARELNVAILVVDHAEKTPSGN